tara:strand:+ start:1157 stop:1402 length:246 start_codon:yes stop_codon:yes gene_type:complete
MGKKEKTYHEHMVELYNTFSNEDLMHLFYLSKDRFFVYNPNDRTCYDLDLEVPCCPNGPQIQINILEGDIKLKPMVAKEVF